MRILPEYLLLFGLLFGGFSLSGNLSESYISHAEVAYIELLTEQSAVSEIEVQDRIETEENTSATQTPFYAFSFRSFNQAYLIHHFLAREKERSQSFECKAKHKHLPFFTLLHVPLYARDDFSIAITA